MKSTNPYHRELARLVDLYIVEAKPGGRLPEKDYDADGDLTGAAARTLHRELCRQSGISHERNIAEDWNSRSPKDDPFNRILPTNGHE